MNAPEGTGSRRDKDPDEGIVLPSWIDAAIAKTRGDDASPDRDESETEEDFESYPPAERAPYRPEDVEAGAEDGETYAEELAEAYEEESVGEEPGLLQDQTFERSPSATAEGEPFPSFLERIAPRSTEPEPPPPPEVVLRRELDCARTRSQPPRANPSTISTSNVRRSCPKRSPFRRSWTQLPSDRSRFHCPWRRAAAVLRPDHG